MQRGTTHKPESIEKMKKFHKEHPINFTEEVRKKMSEGIRKNWEKRKQK